MSITIGLVQYSATHRIYLPYSAGLMQASLQRARDPQRYSFLLPRVFVAPLAGELEALAAADVVGFSIFVWNEQRSLAVARQLKQIHPEVLTIFGGPQVPDQAESWMRAHPYIDVACHGEGEDVFLQLMEAFPQRDWEDIPGLSWLDASGAFRHTPPTPKRRDLEAFPSPFLTGVFDPLMAAYPDQVWSSTWETNRGCPFTCVFCDWGSATASRVNRFDTPRLLAEIDWFAAHQLEFIFCADANFGILTRDKELALYAAEVKQRTGFPGGLVVQNAKNISDRTFEIQCIMSKAGLDTQITVSLQSLHPPTLKASGRQNISLEAFETLQSRLRAEGVHTYTDLIVGLPEETYDSFADGLSTLIGRGQYHALQIFCADILPNAPMADPAFRERYKLETVRIPSCNVHSPILEDPDGIVEYQNTVISTASMPREDWVRTRILTWMVDLVFFKPGTLRIPLMMLHAVGGLSFRPLLEAFMQPDHQLRTLDWVWRFFEQKALSIQQGEAEYCPGLTSDGGLQWWSPCEAVLDLLL
ncbi:MAG: radical SAM protein, partial [Candidatus Sericytochromatia bacterium]